MKLLFTLLLCITLFSCNETAKKTEVQAETPEMKVDVKTPAYPKNLTKIFDAHGGLAQWKNKKVISFEIPKGAAKEIHTTDLKTRNEKIEMPDMSMGYDGTDFWLLDTKDTYKGDPIFYHNLMFYFYSMPFITADNGINYGETEALEFEGVSYPGIRISYDAGVGASPKDEYFLHYNPKTYQMEWLGYTVTYSSGEKSDKVNWIRYADWMHVDDLLLPKAISWYKHEGRTMIEPRNTVNFENVKLHKTVMPNDFFAMPEMGKKVLGN